MRLTIMPITSDSDGHVEARCSSIGERAALAVLQPLLCDAVAAAVRLPHGRCGSGLAVANEQQRRRP